MKHHVYSVIDGHWKLIGTGHSTKKGGVSIKLFAQLVQGANIVTVPETHNQKEEKKS